MPQIRWGLAAALVLVTALAVSAWQSRPRSEALPPRESPDESLEDRLVRRVRVPFVEETPLSEVANWLRETVHAQVVLDRAALERQAITRETTVQLDLEEVRLKTALRLLLDQVGLAYRLESEDNLIVLTDADGASEPLPRILGELEALHRDVHAVQDTVDELYDLLVPEDGPAVRTPTIIEERPDEEGEVPAGNARHRTRPG